MKKSSYLKFKCCLLTLLYSVSLSSNFSSYHKKSESNEIFYGNKFEVWSEYDNPNSDYLAYVIDERNDNDPNMEIYMSHLIRDEEVMIHILSELLKKEKNYPTEWNRTIESMYKEWKIHNICYDLGIRRDCTVSVDLNNDDEDDYNENRFLTLLMKKPHSDK